MKISKLSQPLKWVVWIGVVVVIMAACHFSQHRPFSPRDKAPARWCEDSAMTYQISAPYVALALVDSAASVGRLSEYRAAYLRAMICHVGLQNPDSAMLICKRITESLGWRDYDDELLKVQVHLLMANLSDVLSRPVDLIHNARIAARMTYKYPDMQNEMADLYGRVGRAMVAIGEVNEGQDYMTRALDNLTPGVRNWNNLLTYINVCGALQYTLQEVGASEKVISLSYDQLQYLGDFERFAYLYQNLPQVKGFDSTYISHYVQLVRGRCYVHLVRGFADLAKPDSAHYWLRKYDEIGNLDTLRSASVLLPALVTLHLDSRALQTSEKMINEAGKDTIRIEYAQELKMAADIFQRRGYWRAANEMLCRALAVQDSVMRTSFRDRLTDEITLFRLDEERRRVQLSETKYRNLINGILGLLLAAAVFGIYRFWKDRHQLRALNTQTANDLEEAKQQIKQYSESTIISPEQLYDRILLLMEQEKPYLDTEFDIEKLSRLVHSNRTYISKAINVKSGQNFRTWLSSYRIRLVQDKLLEEGGIRIDELCQYSGYASRSTLFRQFRNATGMTPTEWLNKQQEERQQNATLSI